MLDIQEALSPTSAYHLRPLNPSRDLYQVADLIETCFSKTMDQDGRDYLRQMRQAARDEAFVRWAPSATDASPMGMNGYVWEENGRIIGNLSLIAMFKGIQRVYLIANVATHPDQRRRGIGRSLTEAAIDYARRHGASSAWLQVRQDNLPAYRLYESLGFIERARRTTWVNEPHAHPVASGLPMRVTPRRSSDWSLQRKWLTELYPKDIVWNLPIHPARFNPSLVSGLARFLFNEQIEHWSAFKGKELLGVLSWEPARTYADNLWFAASPANEELAMRSLLPVARRLLSTRRPLSLNYPTGHSPQALLDAGFIESQTLIWMEKPLG